MLILNVFWHLLIWIAILLQDSIIAQQNKPPEFLPGGDMSRFSIREDTPQGTSVYTLRAIDPEDSKIHYGIISSHFSVDSSTGVVTLNSTLDREKEPTLEVTLIATDEEIFGQEANTVTLQREIIILDQNDNPPMFQNIPYLFTVKETTSPDTVVYDGILVTDKDAGINGEIKFSCDEDTTPEACGKFFIRTKKEDEGKYRGIIILQGNLDYDISSTYVIAIKAEDLGIGVHNVASAMVVAYIEDEQNKLPVFEKKTYSFQLIEGFTKIEPVLTVKAFDGDRGNPRQLDFTVENDPLGCFQISSVTNTTKGDYTVTLSTTGKPLDREDPDVEHSGGTYNFKIKATELEDNLLTEDSSIVNITVSILDVNDNPPVFTPQIIEAIIPENSPANLPLPGLDFRVVDPDNAENSTFNLTIDASLDVKNIFNIHPVSSQNEVVGYITISNDNLLDYENISLRVLNFKIIATDIFGLSSIADVKVTLEDVNDNKPVFDRREYKTKISSIQENKKQFLILNATDLDSGIYGKITYSILFQSSEHFTLDATTGAVYVSDCENSTCMLPQKDFSLVVKASDGGNLSDIANIIISVEKTNENNFTLKIPASNISKQIINSTANGLNFPATSYNVTIRETTKEGTVIAKYTAMSNVSSTPIHYSILSGARENFIIDPLEGTMMVAPGALLDVEAAGNEYIIKIQALQQHLSQFLTATTESIIIIEDVNNKPPYFSKPIYTRYFTKEPQIGEEFMTLEATDPDTNSNLKFSLSQKMIIYDQNGSTSKVTNPFEMNTSSGSIILSNPLPKSISTMIFSVTVEDTMAQTLGQNDTAEVLITLPTHPIPSKQKLPPSEIELSVPEEIQPGTVLLTLNGNYDDDNNQKENLIYEKMPFSDPNNYFSVDKNTGVIRTEQRLDYEALPNSKMVILQIASFSSNTNIQNSTIIINIKDINDNYPVFEQENYFVSVLESDNTNNELLRVQAIDKDEFPAFRTINYFLDRNGNEFFTINKNKGIITKKFGTVLDRETKSNFEFNVIAVDNPKNEMDQRTSSVKVHVEVLDVNDNAPIFSQKSYSVVIQETTPVQHVILTVHANDIDDGINSEIEYSIINAKELMGYFNINPLNGELYVNNSLSNKGWTDPYSIIVRAKDKGIPPKFSDVEILITIVYIPSQHEVPQFISPESKEVIYISENAKMGSSVYQARLSSSHFKTLNRIQFSLLDRGYGGSSESVFRIDQDTGLVSLRNQLDREKREKYTIIILAETADSHTAFCELNIIVTDENDNKPIFLRPKESEPLQMFVNEECDLGTVIGIVGAVDSDTGKNAIINYQIIGQNEHIPFSINQTHDNKGVIFVTNRLDYELKPSYNIIIKAKNPDDDEVLNEGTFEYNKEDFTLLQIQININDIDDNAIYFVSTIDLFGIRSNVPQQFFVTKLEAKDPDISDNPIHYFIEKTQFLKEHSNEIIPVEDIFTVEKETGVVRTVQTLSSYDEGTFLLNLAARSANNPKSFTEKQLNITIIHKVDMLKFIFESSPPDVHTQLNHIHREFSSVLKDVQPESLQLAETHVMMSEENDDSELESKSVSVCFQLIGSFALDVHQVQQYLDPNINTALKKFYNSYNISDIDSCGTTLKRYKTTWIELLLIIIIGSQCALVLIGTFIICCWQRMKNAANQYPQFQAPSECQSHHSKVRFQANDRK